jgi:hypothetical protein
VWWWHRCNAFLTDDHYRNRYINGDGYWHFHRNRDRHFHRNRYINGDGYWHFHRNRHKHGNRDGDNDGDNDDHQSPQVNAQCSGC